MTINFEQVFSNAERKRNKLHKEGDIRSYVYRGGNAGCLLPSGGIIGKCPRRLLIQWLGIDEEEKDLTGNMMIKIGYANEDIVMKDLTDEGVIFEAEPKLSMDVDGVKLGARPDLVIKDETGKIVQGLELKCIASHYVANSVGFGDTPKGENLCQSAVSQHLLGGIPYQLIYFNYSIHDAMSYIKKARGNQWNLIVKPFRHYYTIGFDANGFLMYSNVQTGVTVTTAITLNGILSYYKYINALAKTKTLPILFKNTKSKSNGERVTSNPCKDCSLRDICNETMSGDSYDEFLTLYREHIK
jgi:hypothetical protein